MFQFTVKGLMALIVLAAVVCTVLFAIPPGYRVAALAVGVMALPAPLLVGYLHGGPWMKAFATGGLIGYAVWFVILGVPVGWQTKQALGSNSFFSVAQLATDSSTYVGGGGPEGGGTLTYYLVGSFVVYAGLYAPWFVVLLSGLSSLYMYALRDRRVTATEVHR